MVDPGPVIASTVVSLIAVYGVSFLIFMFAKPKAVVDKDKKVVYSKVALFSLIPFVVAMFIAMGVLVWKYKLL